ncbi:MAG: hypothetical protein QM564_08360 [Bergeyella sp.]
MMTTIPLKISNNDISRFNLKGKKEITFADLQNLITLEFARKALKKANKIAKEKMTLEEINAEIKATRNVSHSLSFLMERSGMKTRAIANWRSNLYKIIEIDFVEPLR